MIPVSQPDLGIAELREVAEAFQTGWIGLGPKVSEFESEFAEAYGYDNVLATNSGTAALDLALKAAAPAGTEVLVPPITWISTAHVARYNDYDVGFVDVRQDTLNMSPDALRDRITDETAAIIPVHYGGQPAAIDELASIAHEHDALVIEDAAHAVGATFDDEYVGHFGDVACFSFQATKPLTAGEGGALVTDDDSLASRARRLSKLGVDKSTHERADDDSYDWYYEVTDVGYKYFMHDVSAAVGLVQLVRQPALRNRRNAIAARYDEAFEALEWTSPLTTKPDVTHARYNYTLRVPAAARDALIAHLGEHDVGASVHYMPLYMHPVFDGHEPDTPTTAAVWEELVTIPMSPALVDAEVDAVVDAVRDFESANTAPNDLSSRSLHG